MKVYELMDKLSKMPAGAVVRIKMIKELNEMPVIDGKLREINFELKEVEGNSGQVILDGWCE